MSTQHKILAIVALLSTCTPHYAVGLTAITVGYNCNLSRVVIDESTGIADTIAITGYGQQGCNAMAVDQEGEIYVAGIMQEILRINPATGEATVALELASPIDGLTSIRSMSFGKDGRLYVLNRSSLVNDPLIPKLFAIDLDSGTVELIGAPGGDAQALETSASGTLYGWHPLGIFFEMRTEDAQVLRFSETPAAPLNLQSLAYTPDGHLIGATDSTYYRIDVDSGAATLIATGDSIPDVRGMAFIPEPDSGALLIAFLTTACALFRRSPLCLAS